MIQSEHCDDGELSGDETDIDCGGSCGVCDIARLCDENNDCGSGYCDLSGASNGCLVDADCSDNLFCNGVETCSNGTCLVANSPSCAVDQVCNEQQDVCTDKCNNGIWDENETGVDCGGVCEIKCQGEQHCTVNEDCASGQCNFDDEKSDGVNIQPNSYPQGANQESNVIP